MTEDERSAAAFSAFRAARLPGRRYSRGRRHGPPRRPSLGSEPCKQWGTASPPWCSGTRQPQLGNRRPTWGTPSLGEREFRDSAGPVNDGFRAIPLKKLSKCRGTGATRLAFGLPPDDICEPGGVAERGLDLGPSGLHGAILGCAWQHRLPGARYDPLWRQHLVRRDPVRGSPVDLRWGHGPPAVGQRADGIGPAGQIGPLL